MDDCPDGQDDAIVQLGVSQGGILVDVSYRTHAILACGHSALIKTAQTIPFLRRAPPKYFVRAGSDPELRALVRRRHPGRKPNGYARLR